MDFCLQHGECHAHIGWMHGNAGIARAEDCIHAIQTTKGRAAAAWLAFIAWRYEIVEIGTACSLHQISACRGHIAQLLRGPRPRERSKAPDSAARRAGDRQYPRCATSAPIRKPPRAVASILSKGSLEMSMSFAGRSTSIRIRSTRLVPPAMNFAAGLAVIWRSASATLSAREYSNQSSLPHRLLDRRHDIGIGTAAADIAAHQFADFGCGLGLILGHQAHRRTDLTRRAVPTLECVVVDKSLLQRMKRTLALPALRWL